MDELAIVDFYGDKIFAVERDKTVYVAVKPISDHFGLDWSAQRKRMYRDAILAEGVAVMAIPPYDENNDVVCLRLDLVPGWLFGISVARVRKDLQAAVLRYKRECFRVLFEHFAPKHTETPIAPPKPEVNVPHLSETEKMRRLAQCRRIFGTRAAANLWVEMGLPIVAGMGEAARQMHMFEETTIRYVRPTQIN